MSKIAAAILLTLFAATLEGYGAAVMQKDPQPMQTLGQAVEAARRDKKLN